MRSRSAFRPHGYGRVVLSTLPPKPPKKLWTPRRPPEKAEESVEEDPEDLPIGPGDLREPLGDADQQDACCSPRYASQRTASRSASRMTVGTTLSRPWSARTSAQDLEDIEEEGEDKPMPIRPWCGRCPPLRPSGILPLKPEEVSEELRVHATRDNAGRRFSGPVDYDYELAAGSLRAAERLEAASVEPPPPPPKKLGRSKTHDFAQHMKQTVMSTGLYAREWQREIEDIQLFEGPARSRFSRSQYDGENPAAVLRKLTAFQVGLLERWAINHMKLQYIEVCAKEHHHSAPLRSNKNLKAVKYATLCQLVRRYAASKLNEQEYLFLFEKLEETPFFSTIPSHLLPSVVKRARVLTSSREREIFKEGDVASGVYVLVQGDVVLRSKASVYGRDHIKQAPVALLDGDLFAGNGRPFFIKPDRERVWSRSAFAYAGREGATSVTMLLFLPVTALEEVSDFFRVEESKSRNRYISTMFAQAMLLAPKQCMRCCKLFSVEAFKRNDVLLQSGSKLAPGEAQLMLIVEGEVCLVTPRNFASRKRGAPSAKSRQEEPKERRGPGEVIGQAALYGLSYPHTAVVASESAKLLCLRVADYLERLLHRSAVLDPPAGSHSNSPNAMEAGGGSTAASESRGVQETVKAMMSLCLRSCKIHQDTKALMTSEWKSIGPKQELARYRTSLARSQQPDDSAALSDLCYPRDCDLFPSAQRSASTMQRSSDWCTFQTKASVISSATTSPSSMSTFQALDSKIALASATFDRLDATHWSHTVHGVHVEDATGSPLPDGPLLEAPPGSRVLLSCGAIAGAQRPTAWQLAPMSAGAS